MDAYTDALIKYLSGFVTENRLNLFQQVLSVRTRYIAVLIEDIYQSQNASAILRTCDCLGIQDVHIVEQANEYVPNPEVSLGSDQWLSIYSYREEMDNWGIHKYRKPSKKGGESIVKAVMSLKEKGYRMIATSPHRGGSTPETFDLEAGKAVIMLGTELNGLTDKALDLADEFIQIPMAGFTESFNISVSAAIIIYNLRKRLERYSIDWRIPDEDGKVILLDWLRKSIRMSEKIEEKFCKDWESRF